MIRQPNKLKLGLLILFAILEIGALISAYAAHYFTKTRMGMLRHVIYLNGKWEKIIPLDIIKWLVVVIILIITIISVISILKSSNNHIGKLLRIISVGLGIWTMYYLLFRSAGVNRAYYIICLCLVLGTVFQNIICKIYEIK
ncbi:hypothetical protein E9840_11720 [Tissierella creatinini]|nr:hypothetical protein E9840_11720 [Tissierella creatinini]TJX60848.1 hypothetical protein E8P77_19535 [Soehngenia saccharolytica]